jgi:isocitrate/isopropylmalate dehydrogenase
MIERRVLVLPGDNIGPEIIPEAIKVLTKVDEIFIYFCKYFDRIRNNFWSNIISR